MRIRASQIIAALLVWAAIVAMATCHAAESGIEWTAPVENEDGSAIGSAITYVVEWGENGVYGNTDSTTNTTLTVQHAQNKWISARVKAVNEVGAESVWSEALVWAVKVAPLPPPNLRLKDEKE